MLRDVHLPAEPSWWPPAPGWWLVAAAVLLVIASILGYRAWHARRRRRWLRWFEQESAAASGAQQVAALSSLLRRAARRVEPRADRLQGEEWLRFLDGERARGFQSDDGRLLLEGGFRRDVDSAAVLRLRDLARPRFLELMAGRR